MIGGEVSFGFEKIQWIYVIIIESQTIRYLKYIFGKTIESANLKLMMMKYEVSEVKTSIKEKFLMG